MSAIQRAAPPTGAVANVTRIQTMMQNMRGQIEAALPKHMTPDRMMRIALTELRKTPGLADCEPLSFIAAIVQCAQIGLEPGSALGHVFLVPFKNTKRNVRECTVITGYKGRIELAQRSGRIGSITADVVWPEDEFTFELGTNRGITHKPALKQDDDGGPFTHVYAVATYLGSGIKQFEVMSRQQIEAIKTKHGKNNPVWDSEFVEMARKTVVHRLCKYLPQSPEMVKADEIEVAAMKGDPANWQILDASYEPEQLPLEPEKSAEARASAAGMATRTPGETAELETAQAAFDMAIADAVERGVDVQKVLGVTPLELGKEGNIGKIRTATGILERAGVK